MSDSEKLQEIEKFLTDGKRNATGHFDYCIYKWQQTRETGNEKAADEWWEQAMQAQKTYRLYGEISEAIYHIIH